jgi:flagellar basal body-associated protein FliL
MNSKGDSGANYNLSDINIILPAKEEQIRIDREEIKRESRKRWALTILLLSLVLFLFLGLIYSVYLFSERVRIRTKAESSSLTRQVEINNSYFFASPIKAKAGSNEKVRITVFLLDSKGMGVEGKTVNLISDGSLKVEEVQPVTDDLGKAVFDVFSSSTNVYTVEASVDGVTLPQQVRVVFE